MLLVFLAVLMKFADISKMHAHQCTAKAPGQTCTSKTCWQHSLAAKASAAQATKQCSMSHGSDTSSGCDSNSSSSTKENYYYLDEQQKRRLMQQQQQQHPQQQQQQQHHSLTPQQLQQLRQYQRVQQQQLELLQRKLLQRRRLQQHLQEQGISPAFACRKPNQSKPIAVTCNQQYLLQQQQQQQFRNRFYNNNNKNDNYNNNYNDNDVLNNNNQNNNYDDRLGFLKGQKSRRGMTEFSTNNDHKKTHFTQPLLHNNSPRHFPHTNSPQHYVTYNNITPNSPQNITHNHHHTNSTAHNHKNNQQTLQINSSANLLLNHLNSSVTVTGDITAISPTSAAAVATATTPSSAIHSPLHAYQKPLNSPNNTPLFAYGGYYNDRGDQNPNTTSATHQQLLRNSKWLTHTQYHQHLNDLLVQQQNLQQHQQQVLRSGKASNCNSNADVGDEDDGSADDLSEESLKQNVAIVLNNLDRYNNALRSIILNEQVSTNTSSVFFGEDDDDDDDNLLLTSTSSSNNNNFLLGGGNCNSNKMAAPTPATPESDYNSNATTPGSRAPGPGILSPYDSNMMTAHQQHQQQNKLVGALGGGVGVNSIANGLGGGCGGGGGVGVGAGNNLNCSLASSHDFTHDNSDYQWFLDYGYRDGCSGMQRSVLSSLSASYNGIGDLIYYEDLAKNLDANLAEVDMESFRAEDIHSLLSQLPSYCKSLGGDHSRLQQSLMLQQLQQQQQQYTMHQQQQQQQQQMYHNMLPSTGGPLGQNVSQTSIMSSANEMIDNSICKSELLFSPVKESQYSVDSLDMDAYPDDGDIILTCKANKDNYTIAFEGSVLYSDDSFYAEPNEIALRNKQNFINLHSNLEDIVKRKPLEVSMTRSEQTCCNSNGCNRLQKSQTNQLQRYPSGNNNTSDAITLIRHHTPQCSVRKSSSLPNLRETAEPMQLLAIRDDEMPNAQLNVSQAISTSTVESNKSRNLLPMCQMPISCNNSTSGSISENLPTECQQHEHAHSGHHHHHRRKTSQCCGCGSASAGDNHNNTCGSATAAHQQPQQTHKHAHISGSASSGNSNPPASINLVKLFIKQKSSCNNSSSENQASAHTCMDVSSGCWPSSDAAASSSSSSLEQRLRKKSMNDSGKGSALSRHDEEDLMRDGNAAAGHSTPKKQYSTRSRNDAVFCDEADQSSSSTGSLTVTNSPAHRRRSVPLRNPQLSHLAMQLQQTGGSTNSSDGAGSRSNSEQITQVYVSSSASSTGAGVNTDGRRSRRTDAESMARVSQASNSDMITRSMQTSCGSLSTRSSLSERFRCVPPSFLAKLNNLAQDSQAPIYVIYPNYALPDLGFVKTHSPQPADVIFSPFNYKTAVGGVAGSSGGSTSSLLKKRLGLNGLNEDEILQNVDYKQVSDWQSLATLLPPEFRRRLRHIPEVGNMLGDLDSELSQKPLFCMSPPIRRSRAHVCDCTQIFQGDTDCAKDQGSSSSGSSQQPSSGYRGSSTMLTDSELDHADPLKQMYVYQYDQQQRMDAVGGEATRCPPVPMPRGILRKSSSQTSRSKRNSMIEQQQQTKLSKLEKRRSLQEPPYHHAMSSAEELCEVFEEEDVDDVDLLYAVPKRRQSVAPPAEQRLSRKDMDARARAENFLSSVPRSELKYYAEIAAILETSSDNHPDMVPYDAAALKKEVSRVLSQQKKVSFHDVDEEFVPQQQQHQQQQQQAHLLAQPEVRQRFSTPPNSPNISMATASGGRISSTDGRRYSQADLQERKRAALLDEKEKRKIESNRFKRLQIQWELMSKDSSMLKELANDEHTKSGGSTPTSANAHKSRIPRPVSYPAGRRTDTQLPTTPPSSRQNTVVAKTVVHTKPIQHVSPQIARITAQDGGNGKASATTRSPSRIVPPKRYSLQSTPPTTAAAATAATTPSPVTTPTGATTRARTPNSRAAVTAPNTPKRRVQSPRTIPRVR